MWFEQGESNRSRDREVNQSIYGAQNQQAVGVAEKKKQGFSHVSFSFRLLRGEVMSDTVADKRLHAKGLKEARAPGLPAASQTDDNRIGFMASK